MRRKRNTKTSSPTTPVQRQGVRRSKRKKSLNNTTKIKENLQNVSNCFNVMRGHFPQKYLSKFVKKNRKLLLDSMNNSGAKVPVKRTNVPLNLKRTVFNEYAGQTDPVPKDDVFQYLCHRSKNQIVSPRRKSLRNLSDSYVLTPTEDFCLSRRFVLKRKSNGDKCFNVAVSVKKLSYEFDDNVNTSLQSLNLKDKNEFERHNRPDLTQGERNECATSVIEIPDSPEPDDAPSLSNNDSDVIFVSSKRKSEFTSETNAKRLKIDNSVIVVDDDERTPVKQIKVGGKTKTNSGKKKKAVNSVTKRITRSFTRLNDELGGSFMATSTPKKNSPISTENAYNDCVCLGAHSCVAKPNLDTIPEELNDKKYEDKATDVLFPRNQGNPHTSKQNNAGKNTIATSPNARISKSFIEYNDDLDVFGSNFLSAGPIRTHGLRPIFIDGSNIAMGHTNGKYFSVKGLKICIDYFLKKGHEVTAVVPMFRKKHGQNSDPVLLRKLENQGRIIFTPARTIKGRHVVPYDDRYVVLMAAVHKGIVVTSDNFKDLLAENPRLAETIETRVLNPTWMRDMIIFPLDPLGRYGPSLNQFLRFP